MSSRRLGQHFLADPGWRQRIFRALPLRADDVWVEIGAGHGEMTRQLARGVKRVVAIELDPPLVSDLERLATETGNLTVVAGNILETDVAAVAGAPRLHVYGNLPYYITSPILHQLFRQAHQIETIHIVIQLEVAARLAARPGRRDYGYLSVLTQFYSQPEILFRIPPGAFRPPPKVASALVRLKIHPQTSQPHFGISDADAFLQFVQRCFAQKRKTLLNNLKAAGAGSGAPELLRRSRIRTGARAEELSLEQFAGLFRNLPAHSILEGKLPDQDFAG